MGTPQVLTSIVAEYQRYKMLAESAMAQLAEEELSDRSTVNGNPVAVIAWHIAGNLSSRFTDFLESDGEKPWRNREEEFAPRKPTREELMRHWEHGWRILFAALGELSDDDLMELVTIRGTQLSVHGALHRSLAHTSYHVGQIVYLAKAVRGPEWQYLSIPPGETGDYNRNPTSERAEAHTARLRGSQDQERDGS